MKTLYEDGISKALKGLTTIREVYEVAGLGEHYRLRLATWGSGGFFSVCTA